VKLFQQLLIAPALLGLFSPIAATANELNIDDVTGYSSSEEVESINDFNAAKELAVTNSRVDALEAEFNNFEAGSFSDTTSLTGSASFQIGAVDQSGVTEKTTATYSYDLDLNTSFTGEDNLYVGIETGNYTASTADFVTSNSGGASDILKVTSAFYTFPFYGAEMAVGPLLDNDDLMPTATSRYSDKFFMSSQAGGMTSSNFNWEMGVTGAGVAIAKNFDNGFNASASVLGISSSTTSGFLTKEGTDVTTLSVGYDKDNYGFGLVYVISDDVCTFVSDYDSTCASSNFTKVPVDTTTIGGYWSPYEGTTLSANYGIMAAELSGYSFEDLTKWHLGIDQELGNGVLSAAVTGNDFFSVNGWNVTADYLGEFAEIYYTYDVNDSIEVVSGISWAVGDRNGTYWIDRTAIGSEVTFKF